MQDPSFRKLIFINCLKNSRVKRKFTAFFNMMARYISQKQSQLMFISLSKSQKVKNLQQSLQQNEVKVASVPQIEGLTVQDFLNYAKNNEELLRYLPDERDWVHLD